jgi:8-oxo-dGTP diphosphatase
MAEIRALATDAVVVLDEEVVLLKRAHSPFEASWVLPGGFVEPDETAREACVREVNEEVGLNVTTKELVGLYGDPGRDERGVVSAAYRCMPISDETPTPREEAQQVRTFHPDDLPEMGFDHKQIINDTPLD